MGLVEVGPLTLTLLFPQQMINVKWLRPTNRQQQPSSLLFSYSYRVLHLLQDSRMGCIVCLGQRKEREERGPLLSPALPLV